jgi:hypothetical protein
MGLRADEWDLLLTRRLYRGIFVVDQESKMICLMKGSFGKMSEDFNEPLEDFKDYM